MFDKRQGYMPTYVEWRLREKQATSDPNDPASYTKLFNQTETKWSQINSGKKLWAPMRVVNKMVGPTSQEWFIEATWKSEALQNQYFDVTKINKDRDGNPLSKIRKQMQNAAEKAEADKAGKSAETEKAAK